MQHVADAIVELLADIGPAILVTHSMGGVIGWRAGRTRTRERERHRRDRAGTAGEFATAAR